MATYAIGDLQGCFKTLERLLAKLSFDPANDRLWFVGDLVNRGQGSLDCLRFVRSLGDRAVTVLGNHDLHLLAVAEGFGKVGVHDTLQPVLDAPDRDELLHWLRRQKMLHVEGRYVMVHAGLLPEWDLRLAQQLATEVELALRGANYRALLADMYGNQPDRWSDRLDETERHRITINAMTRMRALTIRKHRSTLDLKYKGELATMPAPLQPWFATRHPGFSGKTVIAGHWSALGLHISGDFIGLDSGCVWGRELTALRLEDQAVFQVACAEDTVPKGWD